MNARARVSVLLAAAFLAAWPTRADAVEGSGERAPAPALLDNMDGAAPVLRLLNAGPSVRLLSQAMEREPGPFGAGAERIVVALPAGESAHLSYALPRARVLPELRLEAAIFCSRPGSQLAALVVLPRSVDPQTGAPRQLLVRSEHLDPGDAQWQRLAIDRLDQLLAAQARVARAMYGGDIDEREAFVSHLVILVPGGPGATELAVDQIAVHGVLVAGQAPAADVARPNPVAPGVAPNNAPTPAMAAPPATWAAPPPAFPRMVQWQGEPFALLAGLGFNAVWMGRAPAAEELAEVRRLGLSLVCPPPSPDAIEAGALLPLDDPIVAWDLGLLAADSDIDLAHRWAQSLRLSDPISSRPTVLESLGMPLEASRIADVLTLGRPMVGSTASWPEYAAWLSQQRRLARVGTPLWVAIDSHASSQFTAQSAELQPGSTHRVPASFNELSLATAAAMGVLPRGLFFRSEASLAAPDSRARVLALELTNMRLRLAESWLAVAKSAAAARTNRDDLTGLVLRVERSHLIVPLRWESRVHESRQPSTTATYHAPYGNASPGSSPHSTTTFVLPGVPESSEAYLLSVAGPQRLSTRRVTGGVEIAVDRLPDDAFVLLTEDGYAFSQVDRYFREHAPRAARLRVELATLRRQQAAVALAQLPPPLAASVGAARELAQVDAQLTAVVETMAARDHAAAFARAAEAERLLDQFQSRMFAAVAPDLPPGASPLPVDWSTLADLVRIETALARGGPRAAFPGGEFENLDEVLGVGWERLGAPPASVATAIRLTPEAPAAGAACLELEARTQAVSGPPAIFATPPVWMTSPPVPVPAGSLIEVTGLVRVDETPMGSADPVLIFDSIGGEASAVRIASALSWTPFRLVRLAPAGADCRITIALGGAGRAHVDSLQYRILPLPTAPAGPVAQQPPSAAQR